MALPRSAARNAADRQSPSLASRRTNAAPRSPQAGVVPGAGQVKRQWPRDPTRAHHSIATPPVWKIITGCPDLSVVPAHRRGSGDRSCPLVTAYGTGLWHVAGTRSRFGRGLPASYGFPPRPSGRGGLPWRRVAARLDHVLRWQAAKRRGSDRPALDGGRPPRDRHGPESEKGRLRRIVNPMIRLDVFPLSASRAPPASWIGVKARLFKTSVEPSIEPIHEGNPL